MADAPATTPTVGETPGATETGADAPAGPASPEGAGRQLEAARAPQSSPGAFVPRRPRPWLGERGPAPAGRTAAGLPSSRHEPPPSRTPPEVREALRPEPRGAAGAELSPRMTAVFGALFGLATVTSVIGLLIQVASPTDERAAVASAALTSESSAPAPAPPPEPKKRKRTPLPSPFRLAELSKDPSVLVATAAIERRSFIDALADKGVPKAQAYRIIKAFEELKKFDKCGRKDRFSVAMDRATRRVRAFEYEVSPSEIYQAREGTDGLLLGTRLDLKIAEEEVVSSFYVTSDVVESYQWVGLEDGVLGVMDEALSGRLSTESFEEGGIVKLIAVEETALGLFSRYVRLLALEYRGPDPASKPVRIYHYDGSEARGYFDERGRQPYAGGWRSPVPGAPVTSKFNPKRLHPVLKKVMPHNGTDFGAPTGTPVYAAYRGVVEWVGPQGPSGNLVTINHPSGIQTGYAHLSRFAPGIKHGDRIGTHALVGYVGSTGRSTGPHLHFTAKKDGKFFDAETLQLDGERVMPVVDRAGFLERKAELDKRLDSIALPEPPPEKPKPMAAAAAPAASASASAEPGIHPAPFVEDTGDDDDVGDVIPGAVLGAAPPPSAGASAPAPPPDPSEQDDGEGD